MSGLLSYEANILSDVLSENSLLITCKGLSLYNILLHLIIHSINKTLDNSSAQPSNNLGLFLLINFSEVEVSSLNEGLASVYSGNNISIISVNNEYNIAQREELYIRGGFLALTNRILIVDLLSKTLSIPTISGVIVNNSHNITEDSIETFILRLISSANAHAAIKAVSDNAAACVRGGFNRLNKLLKCLHCNKLFLWPRFHLDIQSVLDNEMNNTCANLYEYSQPLTAAQVSMQELLFELLELCSIQLKSDNSLHNINVSSVQALLSSNLQSNIKFHLQPQWHKVSNKTKQLLHDVEALKNCLKYLINYNCCAVYRLLLTIRAQAQHSNYSLWLLTDQANKLFQLAKNRIYTLNANNELTLTLEENPKWNLLVELLDRIQLKVKASPSLPVNNNAANARVLIVCSDWFIINELKGYLALGGRKFQKRNLRKFLLRQRAMSRNIPSANRSNEQKALEEILDKMLNQWRSTRAGYQQYFNQSKTKNRPNNSNKGNEQQYLPSLFNKRKISQHKQQQQPKLKSRKTQPIKQIVATEEDSDDSGTEARVLNETENDEIGEVASADAHLSLVDCQLQLNTLLPSGNHDPAATTFQSHRIHVVQSLELMFYAYNPALHSSDIQFTAFLHELQLNTIILYDAHISLLRQVEGFAARNRLSNTDYELDLYFLQYSGSYEEKCYSIAIDNEKAAFEQLIQEKATMVAHSPHINQSSEVSANYPKASSDLGADDGEGLSLRNSSSNLISTRQGGAASVPSVLGRVIVDVREFRSNLPSLLHFSGLELVPVTLLIGDYILTPHIALERKSLSDLIQSLQSGRLYKQITAMQKYYRSPVLLIEFSPNQPFQLLSRNELTADIQIASIHSKLVLLTLHFPALRYLWAKSCHHTAKIVIALKNKQFEPNLAALSAAIMAENCTAEDKIIDDSTSHDFLRCLPGVTSYNINSLVAKCGSLLELVNLSLEQLQAICGEINGRKLFNFLHKNAQSFF
jgi:DNA excision repair protein ERCC-4